MRFQNNKGGITLFLAIIFMALLVLAGVFIDAARIAVAERKVQSSLNTTVRSVLAGYDKELIGQFGIYGLDGKSEKSVIKADVLKYFQANLKERHQGIKFINYEINSENINILASENLLTDETYKTQILEYMKYKAPITMTENLIEKFKKAKMGEKIVFVDNEKNVRNIGSNIKANLKKFNNAVKNLAKSIGISILSDLKNSLKASISSDVRSAIDELQKLKSEHLNAKRHISSLDNEIDAYFEAKKRSDEAAKKAEAESTANEFLNTKNEKNVLENIFNNNIAEIEGAISILSSKNQQLEVLEAQLKSLGDNKNSKPEEISKKQQEINNIFIELQSSIDEMKLTEINEIFIEDELQNIEPAHEQDIDNRKGFFEDLRNAIGRKLILNNIKSTGGLISDEEFTKATMEDQTESVSMAEGIAKDSGFYNEQEAEKRNTNILSFMNKFKKLFSITAQNARDNMYITEYIMDKYTFATSQTERNHFFNKAEVEYILCGQDIEAENAATIMASMWFLRFGIDTVDYYATSKIPHPLARLVWALTEGTTRAFKDVFDLYTTTEGCGICPSLPGVKVSYSELLKIFLLMEGEKTKLNRMRQLLQVDLMQQNKDFRLGNYETVVRVNAEVKINLLFMPLLQLDKLNLQHFKGGKYVIKKEVVSGY
jgi:hypothetical protein